MFDYSDAEITSINEALEPKLEWAKKRTAETERMALDCTRLLACAEERLDEYQGQGFFNRCWYSLCGKNGEVQRANQKDLILMQKYAWRYINLLNERDLLLAHSMLTVKNNLLTLAFNEEETRNQIIKMADKIGDRFEILEDRIEHLEVATNIISWLLTLEFREYAKKYPPHFRLLKLLKDFLQLKGGDWNINEIRFLQKGIKEVDLEWKRKITLLEFINELIDEIEAHSFRDYQTLLYLESVKSEGFIPEAFILENISVASYASQLAENYSKSSAIIDTLIDQLKISKKEAIKKVLIAFVQKRGVDLQIRLPLRDLAIEILTCMNLSKDLFALPDNKVVDRAVARDEISGALPPDWSPF
jgi:hypothetical protein